MGLVLRRLSYVRPFGPADAASEPDSPLLLRFISSAGRRRPSAVRRGPAPAKDSPCIAAAVIRRRVVDVEGRTEVDPLRQIRIGDELAAERDQVRSAFPKPLRRGVRLEAAGHNQGSLVF